MSKKTTDKNLTDVQDLFNFLYEACNILRGPIGQDGFKDYITPLLYYKRISDVWDEETDKALAESNGDVEYAHLPEQHRFVIPSDCHWSNLRERTENIGSAIIESMRAIERNNSNTLYGVLSTFSKAQWTNKTVLSDERLCDLIEHLSKRNLGNTQYSSDLMGDAYEVLLKKFADISKSKAGEFYTPRAIVKLLIKIIDPKPSETVYDPACGSGGMLIEAVRYMHNSTLCCGRLFGQEKNVTNAAISRMNLFLHGASDFTITQGDTLRDPRILQNNKLAQFDCVIANPPFSLDKWGAEIWESDKFGRNIWGTPQPSNGDYAWIQHMICSMKQNIGRAAIVLPQGVLFREQKEYELRKQLIESDKLECVITLANNLFYGASIPACLLIFREQKPANRVGRVLMIDASTIYTPKRAQNELSNDDITEIFELYTNYTDKKELAKIVTLRDIENKDYTLSVSRYIEREAEKIKPYAEVKQEFLAAVKAVEDAESSFMNLLAKEGYIK